jgi:hypothetical protein
MSKGAEFRRGFLEIILILLLDILVSLYNMYISYASKQN